MTRRQLDATSRCSGRRSKVRFGTEYDAERAVARAGERGATLYSYGCPLCGGWHLTAQQPDGRSPAPSRHRPRLNPCGRTDTHGMHADCPGLVVVHACTETG